MHCSFTELLTGTRMVKSVMPRRRRAKAVTTEHTAGKEGKSGNLS